MVAATRAEAAYVPASVPLLVTGVGKTAAAARTAAELVRRPEVTEVVNLGTAGALRAGLSGLFLPGTVLNHDVNADVVRAMGLDPEELLEVPGGDDVVLASGDVFVSDPTVRDRIARRAHLVDMEGYAVVWACREAGVPVRLVKHVSDHADAGALAWPELVDRSARVLGEWLRAHVLGDPSAAPVNG